MDIIGFALFYVPQIFAAFIVLQIVRIFLKIYPNSRKLQTWRLQGIHGPNPWKFWFQQFAMFDKNLYKRDILLVKKYGKIFSMFEGDRMSLTIADPDFLKMLLVRDFNHFLDRRQGIFSFKYANKFLSSLQGNEWKETRSIISPTFTSGKMKAMSHLMVDCLNPLMRKIKSNLGQETDMKALFGAFTMDVIARTAFAIETNTHDDPNHPFVVHARRFFVFPPLKLFIIAMLPMFLRNAFRLNFVDMEAFDYLTELSLHMLEKRRKEGLQIDRNYNDFLQLMIDAAEGEIGERDSKSRKKLTQEEIVGNIVIILVAGYETTASTLTSASYALAINPDVQEKVHQEVIDAKKAHDGKLDYETLMSMSYLDAVVHEALRMYPPVVRVERTCSEDYTFDYQGKNIFVPKGTGINVPVYAVHHMEEYYPEPEVFKPERFLAENKGSQDNYKFLSFVIGPRNCIGMRFAMMEAKLALASIIADYKFIPCDKTDIPLDLSRTFVLLNPRRVILKFGKR